MTNLTIAYIAKCTRNYQAYRLWVPATKGDAFMRSMFMASLRRDWELAAVFYRLKRRSYYDSMR